MSNQRLAVVVFLCALACALGALVPDLYRDWDFAHRARVGQELVLEQQLKAAQAEIVRLRAVTQPAKDTPAKPSEK